MNLSLKRAGLVVLFGLLAAIVSFQAAVHAEVLPLPAAEPSNPQPPPAAALSNSGNVTVDFKDADIQNVLRVISFKSGVNIVAGKDVVGTVTIRLVDVPWEKALDVVLKTYGYAYDRDDTIVRVTTLDNLKKGELSTEVFTLNYSQAAEVEKSLKDMLSERGKIRSDVRSNTVIVTDMPTILQGVQKVVERLDRKTPQVLIHAKVIELTLGDADKMGVKWNIDASLSGSTRPTTFPFNARQRSGIAQFLPGGKETYTSKSTSAPVVDGDTGIVTTPAITTYTTTRNASFPEGPGFAVDDLGAQFANLQPTFPVALPSDFKFGTIDMSQFKAVLQMIESRKDSKVLSEPHIVTLNNKEAKILVGDVISIPLFERNSSTGKMEITGYTNKDVGVRLAVTPTVNDANEIVVSVHPEITTLLGYDEITADIKAPHFTTREAVTQVRIKSGQTIAIGGLIKEEKSTTKTKVPFLGDAPLIGKLFKHHETAVIKTDILFFMTVEVVNDQVVPMAHPPQTEKF